MQTTVELANELKIDPVLLGELRAQPLVAMTEQVLIEYLVEHQDACCVILHLSACSKKCLVINGQLPISPKL